VRWTYVNILILIYLIVLFYSDVLFLGNNNDRLDAEL
jgi:hypothetical protein